MFGNWKKAKIPGATLLYPEKHADRGHRAIKISSLVFIHAKLKAMKSERGTIAVKLIIRAVIRKDSTIHGKFKKNFFQFITYFYCFFICFHQFLDIEFNLKKIEKLIPSYFPKRTNSQRNFQKIHKLIEYKWINCRCFVGEGPDQWRTCSDRYFPLSTSGSISSSSSHVSHNNNSSKKKTSPISYSTNKRKGTNTSDAYHQQPPRPGGLQNLEDIASARLWPITYLYSSGPPNSTELSNFVDCNKETC